MYAQGIILFEKNKKINFLLITNNVDRFNNLLHVTYKFGS